MWPSSTHVAGADMNQRNPVADLPKPSPETVAAIRSEVVPILDLTA